MKLNALRRNWERFGEDDPFYAVLSHEEQRGGKAVEEFFESGRTEIAEIMVRAEAVGIHGHDLALDFACGLGRLTQPLADHFDAVLGVDIAQSMIERATRLNRRPDRCTFVLNTAPDLSKFPDSHFDFVLSVAALQHMEPRYAGGYIAEFFRVAKVDGTVAFQVPFPVRHQALKLALPEMVLKLRRRLMGARGPSMQMFGISPETVEGIVRSSGGTVLFIDPKDSGPGYPGSLYLCRKVQA